MAKRDRSGRRMPALLVMLWTSFILMLLSGILYGLGLPEDWARAFFISTVLVWLVLGVALIVQGQLETRAYRRGAVASTGEAGEADADEEAD